MLDADVAAKASQPLDRSDRERRSVSDLAGGHAPSEQRVAVIGDDRGAGDTAEPRELRLNGLRDQRRARRLRPHQARVRNERFEPAGDERQSRQRGWLCRSRHGRAGAWRQQFVHVMRVVAHPEASRQTLACRTEIRLLLGFVHAIEIVCRWYLGFAVEQFCDLSPADSFTQ